jgi:hypothetical protein
VEQQYQRHQSRSGCNDGNAPNAVADRVCSSNSNPNRKSDRVAYWFTDFRPDANTDCIADPVTDPVTDRIADPVTDGITYCNSEPDSFACMRSWADNWQPGNMRLFRRTLTKQEWQVC